METRPATLLKKRFWHRCSPVNFAKFLGTLFLTEHFQCCFCWELIKTVNTIVFQIKKPKQNKKAKKKSKVSVITKMLLLSNDIHFFWLSLKRGCSRCGHGFGGCDRIDGLDGFDGLGGFSGFDGFSGFGRFDGFSGFDEFDRFGGFDG